jgi:integration host factor subunit beta
LFCWSDSAKQPFFIDEESGVRSRLVKVNVYRLWVEEEMLKKDIVDKVSDQLSLQKQDVALAVDIILETMVKALEDKRRIELRGFGSFSVRQRKPRCTKNPRTGKMMDIPQRNTLHFTMSKSLKEALIKETA